MSRPLSLFTGFVAPAAVVVASVMSLAAPPVGASASSTVESAVGFVAGEQRDDGGFGTGEAGFPGFETPDAVLAIGAAAQSDSSWSASEALAAVEAVSTNAKTGLSYLDDFADGAYGSPSAGNAARLVIVAASLGIVPGAFDPDADGAVDLVAEVQAGLLPPGSFGAGGGTGGAIANGGTLWLDSCTLAENYAPGGGGGLSGGGTARNTLLWANTTDGEAAQCDSLASNGYNMLPAASGCLLSGDLSTLIETADALLGPLDEQGVHPLLPGSPAIDSGACSTQFGALITTDQRGVPRPQGASCDIGAVEAEAP